MYETCTVPLAGIIHLEFLLTLARGFLYIAVALWFLTFWGLCRLLWQDLGAGSHPAA